MSTYKYAYELFGKSSKSLGYMAANSAEDVVKRYKKMFPEGHKVKDVTVAYKIKKKDKE